MARRIALDLDDRDDDERELTEEEKYREEFIEYLAEAQDGGYEKNDDEADAWREYVSHRRLARKIERWWGMLHHIYKLVRDDANREIIQWGLFDRGLSQTGTKQFLYQLHESKNRGNGVLKPATHEIRVGSEKFDYLDGHAWLNVGAVYVSTRRELEVYLGKQTYKAAHGYAKDILTRHEACWEYTRSDGKLRIVLKESVLRSLRRDCRGSN